MNFVLVIRVESSYLRYKLQAFAQEFQDFYGEILEQSVVDSTVFSPTKALIEKVFELESSKRDLSLAGDGLTRRQGTYALGVPRDCP